MIESTEILFCIHCQKQTQCKTPAGSIMARVCTVCNKRFVQPVSTRNFWDTKPAAKVEAPMPSNLVGSHIPVETGPTGDGGSQPSIEAQKPVVKARPTLVLPEFVMGMVRVMEHGLTKLGRQPHDWQKLDHQDVMKHYSDSLGRHTLEALVDPYANDKGSHESVLLHIAANAMILWWHSKHTKP